MTQLVNQKADYEEQLRELEERLAEAEANNEEMTASNKQLDEKIENMKKVRRTNILSTRPTNPPAVLTLCQFRLIGCTLISTFTGVHERTRWV